MSKLDFGLGGDGAAGLEWSWRDVFLNSMLVILLLLVVLLFKVHPNKKAAEQKPEEASGNVCVELTWDNTRDIDLDLWVQAPGDTPVGYSARAGRFFDLLRDDLGKSSDITDVNIEHAYSRGIPPGEYTVNAHLYRHDNKGPIQAVLVVRTQASKTAPQHEIVTTKLSLRAGGQELTAFRLYLRQDGSLVAGTVHNLFKPLRSQQSGPRP